MSVAKTVLAASLLVVTAGLAGCQTTEESGYYASEVSYRPRTTVYYDDTPRWRPAPRPVVVAAPRVYYDDVRPIPPRPPRQHVYGGWSNDRPPPPRYDRPAPQPRYDRPYRGNPASPYGYPREQLELPNNIPPPPR